MVFALFVLGLVLMVFGAKLLIKGASKLALNLGISPLVIGLTVVAFGTSAPELAVSVKSSIMHQSSIAVGNVIGSNLFNVLFILGLSGIISPLHVSKSLIKLEVPLLIFISFATYFFGLDLIISRWDGVILFAGLVAYTVFLFLKSKSEQQTSVADEFDKEYGYTESKKNLIQTILNLIFVVIGLVLLVLGSQWLVESAVDIAKLFEINEIIIGLTIVAIGTSLPELVTSTVCRKVCKKIVIVSLNVVQK